MDQHAKILQMLSRIPKNNTSVATDDEKKDAQQHHEGQENHYHPFLHCDRSLRPEGYHLVAEQWNAHQICH
jgi:hypothetical protein